MPRLSDLIRSVFTNRFTSRTTVVAFAPEATAALVKLKDMIEAGGISSIVDRVYPMSEAAAAHHRVESEARQGGDPDERGDLIAIQRPVSRSETPR